MLPRMRLSSQNRLEVNFTSSRCRKMCELQVYFQRKETLKGWGIRQQTTTSAFFCVKQLFWEYCQFLVGCWLRVMVASQEENPCGFWCSNGKFYRTPRISQCITFNMQPECHSHFIHHRMHSTFAVPKVEDDWWWLCDIHLPAQPARNKPSHTLWLACLSLNTN